MKNGEWTFHLIDQLILQGVEHFCIAPGSRSTPLALAVARHPKAKLTVHFDERSLGFYAVGRCMATQKPVVLIVTSGTAVGNLLPSVMEAHHSHLPLILLTADRPHELRDCGARQTTDQIRIFDNFVRWQTDLPTPGVGSSAAFIRSEIAHAVFMSQTGPVHLNCPLREPLYEPPIPYETGQKIQHFRETPPFDGTQLLKDKHKGAILIGRMPFGSDLTNIFALAEQLQWPVLADLYSQARCFGKGIRHVDYLLRLKKAPRPEFLLHFGEGFVANAINDWMKDIPRVHVNNQLDRFDPFHSHPTRVIADPTKFFCDAAPKPSDWLALWEQLDAELEERIEEIFSQEHPFTEADLSRAIAQKLPESTALFFGISMPGRDAEHFCFPQKAKGFLANRGASGIDGQIATAAGVAMALQKPIVALLGDQSCLYDLSSLAFLKKIKTPFLLLISNNFGGGVFSNLPMHQDEHFELLWGVPHTTRFESAAKMFELPYRSSSNGDFGELFVHNGPQVLEVFTSRQENTRFQKELLQKCSMNLFY